MSKREGWYKLFYFCLSILCIAAMILGIGLQVTLNRKIAPAPAIITEFLDAFIVEDYQPAKSLRLFYDTFYSLRDEELPEDASLMDYYSTEQDLFEQVFYHFSPGFTGYELEQVATGFVKVTPIKLDGTLDYPSVGLWYTVKGKRIDTWRIARLQPFSRYDEEYSDDWQNR